MAASVIIAVTLAVLGALCGVFVFWCCCVVSGWYSEREEEREAGDE